MRGNRAARSGYSPHLTAVEVHEAGVAKSAVHGVAEEEEEILSAEMFGGADERMQVLPENSYSPLRG